MQIRWSEEKNRLLKETNERETIIMTEEIFTKSPLDKEEQWYENHSKEFVPMRNQEQLQKELMRSAPKNRESRKSPSP